VVTPEAEIGWYKVWGIEPWDHTYCAIALDLVGEHERARSAYEWLLSTQNDDGSWCAYYDRFGEAEEEAPLGLVSIPFRGLGYSDRDRDRDYLLKSPLSIFAISLHH